MHAEIKRLHEARQAAWKQITDLADRAAAEDREFTAEEDASWAKFNTDIAALDARLAELIDAEERNRDIADAIDRLGPIAPTDDDAPEARDIEAELRRLAHGEVREVVIPAERRDLTKGSATAGGNTVPTSFYDQLLEHMIEVSGVLSAGPTILNTASGENIEVPVTTAHSTAALTAEGAAIAESDPAFAKRTLGAYKYGVIVQVSRELVDDTGIDLLGYLARQAGRASGNALGAHLATGTGSSQPSGIVTGASAGVTGGTGVTGAFTADNLIDLYYSLIAPYRNSPQCAWLMRDATVASVRKLKDTTNQYIWQPGLQVGSPDLLLGKPLHTDPNVAAVGLGAKSVVFGDISTYFVRLAGGVRFERSDDFAFNTDLVSFKCVVRGDGVLADQTGAVKVFTGGAS